MRGEIRLQKKSQDDIIQQLIFDVCHLKVMVDLLRADLETHYHDKETTKPKFLVEEKKS